MRLWSIDPKILDQKGLGAAWREGLMAQSVIRKLQAGEKPGYRNHPQMRRFLAADDPIAAIGAWLSWIQAEAKRRGYNYNKSLILDQAGSERLVVTDGQIKFEFRHLLEKLKRRDSSRAWFYYGFFIDGEIDPHPMFDVVEGPIESWEKVE